MLSTSIIFLIWKLETITFNLLKKPICVAKQRERERDFCSLSQHNSYFAKASSFLSFRNKKRRRKMGRGKTQMKKIENPTNRQVTYSKRRNGLFKKAGELTVLCDAKVSIIMISSTGRLNEFPSPNITTKEVFDRYQKATRKDLWSFHFQKMQEELRQLKEKNSGLKREMRQRTGEDLGDLSFTELMGLEEEMEAAFKTIRERLIKKIENRITTSDRKVNSLEKNCKNFLFRSGERSCEDVFRFVKNEEVAAAAGALANGNLYAYPLHQIQPFNLHHSGEFEPHQLRLA